MHRRPMLLALLGVLAATIFLVPYFIRPVDGWSLRIPPAAGLDAAGAGLTLGSGQTHIDNADYARLFAYFASGVAAYADASHSRVFYPGVPGSRGLAVEGLEGFARTAPLLAAWLRQGRDREIALPDGRRFDLAAHLLQGIREGVNPAAKGYWGEIGDRDQRMVESADIALALWLVRDTIWTEFSSADKANIRAWLAGVFGKQTYGGNWVLFPLVVHSVLAELGLDPDPSASRAAQAAYEDAMSQYVGEGWYADGKGGRIDYYNAWQMHYFYYWLSQMPAAAVDHALLRQRLLEFSSGFQHFFSPAGLPMFGRSQCYRMAAAAPLLAAASLDRKVMTPGLARRALDASWSYFLQRGAVRDGNVTQGYCGSEPELLENYSGRASCLWALRSLVLMFSLPQSSPIWSERTVPLPVERADFDITLQAPGFRLRGDRQSGRVELFVLRNEGKSVTEFKPMPQWRAHAQDLLRRPLRLDNFPAKYDRPVYRSDTPITRCEAAAR